MTDKPDGCQVGNPSQDGYTNKTISCFSESGRGGGTTSGSTTSSKSMAKQNTPLNQLKYRADIQNPDANSFMDEEGQSRKRSKKVKESPVAEKKDKKEKKEKLAEFPSKKKKSRKKRQADGEEEQEEVVRERKRLMEDNDEDQQEEQEGEKQGMRKVSSYGSFLKSGAKAPGAGRFEGLLKGLSFSFFNKKNIFFFFFFFFYKRSYWWR
jgi:hypothetical protein